MIHFKTEPFALFFAFVAVFSNGSKSLNGVLMDFKQKRFFLLTCLSGLLMGIFYIAFDLVVSGNEPTQMTRASSVYSDYQSAYIDKIQPTNTPKTKTKQAKKTTQPKSKQTANTAKPKTTSKKQPTNSSAIGKQSNFKTKFAREVTPKRRSQAKIKTVKTSPKPTTKPKTTTTQKLTSKQPKKIVQTSPKNNKPKMVIILDDVSTQFQTDMIKKTGLAITPSFFPFEKIFQKHASLASEFPSYMIHLPLEAMNYSSPEKSTLTTTSTARAIAQTVKKAKELLPQAKYINNHTGSKFTSNTRAMQKLIRVLDDNDLKFLDSVTTHKTVSNQVATYEVLKRDVFIDHEDNLEYIKTQIDKAIAKAKKNQVAIVIGHPRTNTLLAINEYRHRLQKEVNLVYIDEL